MKTPRITCTKLYTDIPFAHRQPAHKGHCAQIHGHSWGFEFTFQASELDDCGFVIDFGKLKWLKAWLEERFDHTLVLNEDDPWLEFMRSHLEDVTDPSDGAKPCTDLAKIIAVPDCSSEGLAVWLLSQVDALVAERTGGRVRVTRVIVHEDTKNYATIDA